MAQFAQGLGFDLPDAFASHFELFAHLFERAAAAVVEAKTQLQYLALAVGETAKYVFHLLLEQLMAGRIRWRQRRLVLDEIAQVAVVFLADGHFQADRLLADLDDLAHAVRGDLQLDGDLFGGRLAPEFLQQTAAGANQPVDGLHHVHGNANGARLIGDRAGDSLADPPGRVGRELEALGVVELLYRANQPDVAFLNQVQQAHAAADVLLRDAHHQAQIRFCEALLRILGVNDDAEVLAVGAL